VVKNTTYNMRRGFYIPDGVIATGSVSNNYVNGSDYGYFWAQVTGNLSGVLATGNSTGPDITVAPIYRGGTCSLNPNRSAVSVNVRIIKLCLSCMSTQELEVYAQSGTLPKWFEAAAQTATGGDSQA